MTLDNNPPVMFVHGWGGSFRATWQHTGITALFEDASRRCIGVDLLGHGTSRKPHDEIEYADLGEHIRNALPNVPVDAVGFSLGALTLLAELVKTPERFNRVVLAGIGDGVFEEHDDADNQRILAGLNGTASQEDNIARLFSQYAMRSDNDTRALAAVLKRPRGNPYTQRSFAHISNSVLIVIGDKDFSLPAHRLGAAFANSKLKLLKNTDHFKTPESFSFIDAILEFFEATTQR